MPENNENFLSRRLNKVLESRFENDKVKLERYVGEHYTHII